MRQAAKQVLLTRLTLQRARIFSRVVALIILLHGVDLGEALPIALKVSL